MLMKKHAVSFSSFCSLLTLAAFLALGQTPASAASPVSHDKGEWWYWAPLPDGYSLWINYTANPGEFLRTNPDGTLWWHLKANKVPVEIDDPSGGVAYLGVGKIETSESVYGNGWDGRTGNISVIAYLDDMSTTATESARFFLTGVLHDLAWVQGNLQFEPLGWDMRLNKEPFTWFE
jgi:hypothetical protein